MGIMGIVRTYGHKNLNFEVEEGNVFKLKVSNLVF